MPQKQQGLPPQGRPKRQEIEKSGASVSDLKNFGNQNDPIWLNLFDRAAVPDHEDGPDFGLPPVFC
jgi:hypothetical protein